MKAVPVGTTSKDRPMAQRSYRFEMTAEEYQQFDDDSEGLCVACGGSRGRCEPDAERYECEECGERQVYGVPQLLIMGLVDIVEEGDDDCGLA